MSKTIKLGNNDVTTIGRFILTVNRDKGKFAMTNINSFVPYGKKANDRMKFMTLAGEVDSLMITRISTSYKPDEDLVALHNIEVLIQHPDVMIAGLSKEEYQKLIKLNLKKPNPKFILTNIDRVETEVFDNETELIAARGILYSMDKPLSKQRLVWLSSSLGLSYRNNITDEKRYKIYLTKNIDTFIQKKKANRDKFLELVKDVNRTEIIFYINELKNLGIITDIGGIWKVGDRPIGATVDHIINYFNENQEQYIQHQHQVQEALASTNVLQ
jgi:hypothetical protein